MPKRSKSSNTAEIARVEELIDNLTQRLDRLKGQRATGTADKVSDFVGEALETIIAQVRESADTVTGHVADNAAKVGSDAIKRMIAEVEHHPLATLAVVAGVGFLFGTARR